jgi:putative membrane protein
MLLDALLAWLHFLCIFTLVGALVAELVLYRREMRLARLTQLLRIDNLYGIAAGLVIISGVLRVTLGIKGASFYLHNPIFWTKMGFFVVVALLSIPPTIHYLRLKRNVDAAGTVTVADGPYRNMWALLTVETVLLACIPFFATLLTHGYAHF